MTERAFHTPAGDPCRRCGLLAKRHLVSHIPRGEPCSLCGLDAGKHVVKHHLTPSQKAYYVGIDGEGQGRYAHKHPDGHRYVMLAWSSEDGRHRNSVEAPLGGRLTTVQCFEFILSIPLAAKIFAFAFGYDLTKILADCPDDVIYKLFRPDLRPNKDPKRPPSPIYWNGYKLNWQAAKFTLAKKGHRRVIWDVFKFYQSKFTTALEEWFSKEGRQLPGTLLNGSKERIWENPEMGPVVEMMKVMKEQRAKFDGLSRRQILEYCFHECAYMGKLAHKLTDAHNQAGLKLRNYYGAGSTASCILKMLRIDKHQRETPRAMRLTPVRVKGKLTGEVIDVVMASFFGGRFENRVVGTVPGTPAKPVYSRDISSAYPYQLTFLPCLECGKWELVRGKNGRRALEGARCAFVRYSLKRPQPTTEYERLLTENWGPFPFRLPTGAIAFPSHSGGGWVGGEEYLAGERIFKNVGFEEAWVYHCDCSHQPFRRIPEFYLFRLRIGKEGPGIVVKLGVNAVFGKLCQRMGRKPPFQCMLWAALITSGTRAQLLDVLGLHEDPRNMLMCATDGIYSLEPMTMPEPRETGTGPTVAVNERGEVVNKPLGGWETKEIKVGVFIARPGVYFPTNPSEEDIKNIRGRGVGRRVIWENWQNVCDAFARGDMEVKLPNVSRFIGAKAAIGRLPLKTPGMEGQYRYNRFPDEFGRARYGQWEDRQVVMDFDPKPKRERILSDGQSLELRAFPGAMSMPYKPTSLGEQLMKLDLMGEDAVDKETLNLMRYTAEIQDQPDGADFASYELNAYGDS